MTALEREGGKQSHLPLSGTCGARARRRPRTHLELCRPGPGHGTGGRPRSRGPCGPGALRPLGAHRGESWQPRAPLRFACSSWLRQPLPRGRGTLRRCPGPRDSRQRLKTRRSDRERPARPSAALPGALLSGPGLRSPLCGHLPSLPELPELHERLRAAAHPRLTPRPPRPPPIVSSQQRRRRRGRAKPCLPPALGVAPRVPAPRRGLGPSSAARQRPAARRSLSRRRQRAALRPSCASPAALPPARPASRAPPPSSSPAGPSARPTPALRPAHLRRCCRPSREKPRQHLPAPPCGALGWGPPARRGPGEGWG